MKQTVLNIEDPTEAKKLLENKLIFNIKRFN